MKSIYCALVALVFVIVGVAASPGSPDLIRICKGPGEHVILVSNLCDGKKHCRDGADEDENMCAFLKGDTTRRSTVPVTNVRHRRKSDKKVSSTKSPATEGTTEQILPVDYYDYGEVVTRKSREDKTTRRSAVPVINVRHRRKSDKKVSSTKSPATKGTTEQFLPVDYYDYGEVVTRKSREDKTTIRSAVPVKNVRHRRKSDKKVSSTKSPVTKRRLDHDIDFPIV